MKFSTRIAGLAAGALLLPASLSAQVQSAGAPAEGVEVQHRYTRPGASQQILTVQAPAASAEGAAAVEGGGDAGGGPPISGLDPARPDATGEGAWVDAHEVYRGVIPGEQDSLPHISRTQARGASGGINTLSWIGFQPLEGMTRVFLQTGRAADYNLESSPDGLTLTVRLNNTRIDISNFRRVVDASYFGRAVSRVTTHTSRGQGASVVLELSRAVSPTVSTNGNYLYLDFAE